MSKENVEIVRRVYGATARRDSEAVLALYDPKVEWVTSQDPPMRTMFGAGTYRGHDGLRRFFHEWHEAWDDIANDPEELVDAGDSVVVVVTDRARGRASGAEVARTHASVWTVKRGKIVRVAWFPTRAEAIEAAGLPE
jgi:ketosteroid isomerase-like protein